jgi:hypothetical protein
VLARREPHRSEECIGAHHLGRPSTVARQSSAYESSSTEVTTVAAGARLCAHAVRTVLGDSRVGATAAPALPAAPD